MDTTEQAQPVTPKGRESRSMKAEFDRLMAEIDRSLERMAKDQQEIDRLGSETRAILARLPVS